MEEACQKAPFTCALVARQLPQAADCKRGQVKFSAMRRGTKVHPHVGPTNCRLRAHLGLKVPQNGPTLRVADQKLNWSQGEVFIFDDSFEHEVDFPGEANGSEDDDLRIVLIVDIWHPDLDEHTKKTLAPI